MVLKHEMNLHALKITNWINFANNWWDNVLNTNNGGGLRLGTRHIGLKTGFYFQIDFQN